VSFELAFHVIGVSHHTASVRVRELLVLTPDEVAACLEWRGATGGCTAILSTCNRFEIYWSGGGDLGPWFREFARDRGVGLGTTLTRLDGKAAVRHLYSVAAGLDSQILGETEILGQVRSAHQAARAAGAHGREFDAVFRGAIAAGRRVRRETALGRHPASVSSAAVEMALATTAAHPGCATAVILGAGEVARGVTQALLEQGVHRVTLVNRRPERARALAAKWGVGSGPWTEIGPLLARADLLFVATGAKHPLVRVNDLAAATRARESDLVVVDLAVPTNVEAASQGLPRIRLFDLDQLQQLRCPAAGQPSIAVGEAQRIVNEEMERLDASLRARAGAPQLAELHQLGLKLACEEADRALASLDGLSDAEREIVREMAERLVRRVLYPVSRSLREKLPQAM
jgi:glutamyl-tRNA reductase